MAAGIPLNDSDRAPWLAALSNVLVSTLKAGRHPVLACSALKESYRAQLLDGKDGVEVIYLKGSYDLLRARMSTRQKHFMKPGMLKSQFDTLEEPRDAPPLDISMPLNEVLDFVLEKKF